jgi:hypothetical protein
MADEYLSNTREKSLGDDSKITEAELHATHENIREGWERLQECKRRIAAAKVAAAQKVTDEFKEELDGLLSEYSMLLMLSR